MNRFSQVVNPNIVNPISFEQFARVPLAKAEAYGKGLAAAENMYTDYDVDEKDLTKVKGAVDIVEKEKSSLVTSIMDEGVTNQTVAKFFEVKKLRDKAYKELVTKAEENKKKIDAWKATLDALALNGKQSVQYSEYVKNKEYEKWQGTLREDGTTQDFEPTYGASYVDIDRDIQETLKGLPAEYKGKIITGKAKFEALKDPTTGEIIPGKIVMKDETGNIIYNNDSKLKAAVDMLTKDYLTPGNVRGDYAEYTNLKTEDLVSKLNHYKEMYHANENRPFGGDQRVIDDGIDRTKKVDPLQSIKPTGETSQTTVHLPVGMDINRNTTWIGNVAEIMGKESSEVWGPSEFWKAFYTKEEKAKMEAQGGKPNWGLRVAGEVLNTLFLGLGTQIGRGAYAIRNAKRVPTEDKLLMLKHFKGAWDSFTSGDNPKWSKDFQNLIRKGDPESVNEAYDELMEHVSDISEMSSATFPVYTGDAMNQMFGLPSGQKPDLIQKDLEKHLMTLDVRNIEDRTPITDKDDKFSLVQKLKKGDIEVRAVLPAGSLLTLDGTSEYIPSMSQAYVIVDNSEDGKGKEYLVERMWEKSDGEVVGRTFRTNASLEELMVTIPYDMPVPVNRKLKTDPVSKEDYTKGFIYRSSADNSIIYHDEATNSDYPIEEVQGLLSARPESNAVIRKIKRDLKGKF